MLKLTRTPFTDWQFMWRRKNTHKTIVQIIRKCECTVLGLTSVTSIQFLWAVVVIRLKEYIRLIVNYIIAFLTMISAIISLIKASYITTTYLL